MNFEYSDEQRLLSDTLRKFLGTGYSFDARGKIIASPAGFSDDVWAALAEMGILSVPFDAVYGGFGGTTIDMLIVFEAFGEALVVEPYLATVGLGGRFVARGGSAEQRARILPALIQGKHKMAFAQTEVDARWDLRRVTTRATKSGDGWVLEGDKRAVLHGGSADTLVVSARTGGASDDARGISLFLVERTAPGVAVTEYRGLDNLRLANVRLSGVRLGRDALLGTEGEGFGLVEEVVDYATALLCAEAVGAIKYAHDATLDYLAVRCADRLVPGAAASHGRHPHLVRAGAFDRVSGVREGRHRGRRRAAPHRLGGQDQGRRRRAPREPGGRAAAWRHGHDRGAEDQPHLPAADDDRAGVRRRRPSSRAVRRGEPLAGPRARSPSSGARVTKQDVARRVLLHLEEIELQGLRHPAEQRAAASEQDRTDDELILVDQPVLRKL